MSDRELERLARLGGFADADELNRLIQRVDLAEPGMPQRFLRWGREDGSKAGIAALLATGEQE